MSRSSGRKSRRRQLQASHQKNWLTGLHAVTETLTAGIWRVETLYVEERTADAELETVQTLARGMSVNVVPVSRERLTELCHSRHHQGVAARMAAYSYRSLDDLVDLLKPDESAGKPCVVVCDRIMDAHNFGAILRCCDAMMVTAVVIGQHEQVGVTPHVARASAGAVNHVPIVQVDSLIDASRTLAEAGMKIAAASEKSDGNVWDAKLDDSVALIVGNEANGVAHDLLTACDLHLRIPMLGKGESLNAAVAAGILLYEIRRQQNTSSC